MRIALITGASSGLGREFAKQIPKLYNNLDELWVVARRTERLEKLKKELDIPVRIFDGDLQRDYIYEKIARELEKYDADIRMLVNAAGYGKIGAAGELDIREQLGMIDVNCRALTRMTLMALPHLSRGSRVILVASAAAFAPQPGFAVYAATKSYVQSFARGMRLELSERGVIVTSVCPGPVSTEFFDRAGHSETLTKDSFMSDAPNVVKKALIDSVKGRAVSVYSVKMKALRAGAFLLPEAVAAAVMKRVNMPGKKKEREPERHEDRKRTAGVY